MPNEIFEQYGKNTAGNGFMERFEQFRKGFSGNPQQMIQNMLNTGRITQDQLNSAMQKASQMMKFMK